MKPPASTNEPPPQKRLIKKIITVLRWLLLIFVSLTTAVIVFLKVYTSTPAFKRQIIAQAESFLDTKIVVNDLQLKIFKGISLRGLVLKDKSGVDAIVVDEFILRYDLRELLKKRLRLKKVYIKHPQIMLIEESPGVWNLARLIGASTSDKLPPKQTKTKSFPLKLDELSVENAVILIKKDSVFKVKGVNLTISDFALENSGKINGKLFTTKNNRASLSFRPANNKNPSITLSDFSLDAIFTARNNFQNITSKTTAKFKKLKIGDYLTANGKINWSIIADLATKELQLQRFALTVGKLSTVDLLGKLTNWPQKPHGDFTITNASLNFDRLLSVFEKIAPELFTALPQFENGKVTTRDMKVVVELQKVDHNKYTLYQFEPSGSIQISLPKVIYPAKQLKIENCIATLNLSSISRKVIALTAKTKIKQIHIGSHAAEEVTLDVQTEIDGLAVPEAINIHLQVGKTYGGSLTVSADYNFNSNELSGLLKGDSLSLDQLSKGKLQGSLAFEDKFSLKQNNHLSQEIDLICKNFRPQLTNLTLPSETIKLQCLSTADLTRQSLTLSNVHAVIGDWFELRNQESQLANWSSLSEVVLGRSQLKIDGPGLVAYLENQLPDHLKVEGEYLLQLRAQAVNLTAAPQFQLETQLFSTLTQIDYQDKSVVLDDVNSRITLNYSAKDKLDIDVDLKAAKVISSAYQLDDLSVQGRYEKRPNQQKIFLDQLKGKLLGGEITASAELPEGIINMKVGKGSLQLAGFDLARLPKLQLNGTATAELSLAGSPDQLSFQLKSELNNCSKIIGESCTPSFNARVALKGSGDILKGDISLDNFAAFIDPLGYAAGQVEVRNWGKDFTSVKVTKSQFQLAEFAAFAKTFFPQLQSFEIGGKGRLSGKAELKDFRALSGEIDLKLTEGRFTDQKRELQADGINLDLSIVRKQATKMKITNQIEILKLTYKDLVANNLMGEAQFQSATDNSTRLEGELKLKVTEILHPELGLQFKDSRLNFKGFADPQKFALHGKGNLNCSDLFRADYSLELADKGEKVNALLKTPPLLISELSHFIRTSTAAAQLEKAQGTVVLQAKYLKKPATDTPSKSTAILSLKFADVNLPDQDGIALESLNGDFGVAVINLSKARAKGKFFWKKFAHPQTELLNGKLNFQIDTDNLAEKRFTVKINEVTSKLNLKKPPLVLGECSIKGEGGINIPQKTIEVNDTQIQLGEFASFNLIANLQDWGNDQIIVNLSKGWLDYASLSALVERRKFKTQLDGQGTFSGEIISSLPEIKKGTAGDTKVSVTHTLDGLNLSLDGKVDVRQINGKINFEMEGHQKRITGNLLTQDVRIKKQNLFPSATAETDFNFDLSDSQTIQVKQFTLSIPECGLLFNVNGQLGVKNNSESNLSVEMKFHGEEELELSPTLKARGELSLPLKISKSNNEDWQILGKLSAKNFTIKYKDKLMVEEINGQLPIKQSGLNLAKTSQAPLEVIPEYELLRTYFLKKEPVANFRISKLHYQQAVVKNIRLDVKWEDNQLQVGRFRGSFWDGDVTGALGARLTGGILRYSVKANLTNIDLKHAFGTEDEKEKSYLTTANLNIQGRGMEDFEGDINVTRIDKQLVDRFLTFIDPTGKNQTINSAREKINRFGKVPKTIHMTARQATMNVVLLLESTTMGLVTTIIPEAVNITSIPIKLLGKLIQK